MSESIRGRFRPALSRGGEGLPPGPRAPSLLQTIGLWTRPLAYLERCRTRHGKRFTLNLLGQEPFVLISDPGEIKQLFTAPPETVEPGAGARILEPVFGPGSLLLLDGEEHLARRRLLLPAFHRERMQALDDLLAEIAAREVATWPRDRVLRLQPLLLSLTLRVITAAVFGPDETARHELIRSRLTTMAEFGNRSPLSAIPAERLPRRFGPHARFARLREGVDELLFAEIAERRAGGAEGVDVLSLLIGARHADGEPLSEAEIRDELMTMLIVGHETTATSLAWLFERLVRTPEALRRLVAEIDADRERSYLRATIQELLRRRPVLPTASPRRVRTPIEVGGLRYRPGVQLVAAIYLVHHDPEIYADPYRFRPERFLESEPGTYTWIPFGGGRRRCLGSGLAVSEMAAVLRAVLATTELAPGSARAEVARRRSFAVGPSRGAEVIVRDRPRPAVASPAPGEGDGQSAQPSEGSTRPGERQRLQDAPSL